MEELKEAQVTLISSETVKPSAPSPPDRQGFSLSFLNQSFPAVYFPVLLVYSNNTGTKPVDIITSLKGCLSETLTVFYPLTGRCEDESTVSCKDQGVHFNGTHVNSHLEHVLNSSRKLEMLSKFLPTIDIFFLVRKPIPELAPLLIQVNVFQCGGVVIGCYFLHKFLDGTSISCFLNYWSALASKRDGDLIKPNFAASVSAFPPSPLVPAAQSDVSGDGGGEDLSKLWHRHKSIKVVGKSFKFSNVAIEKLKRKAESEVVPNPTRFETVAGFVWQQTMAAAANDNQSVLSFSASIRGRTTPPLPKQSMGNLIVDIHACADKSTDLPSHVKEIDAAVMKVKERVETLQGENGVKAYRTERENGFQDYVKGSKATTYTLTSWCKLGFTEVDFGFGKPHNIIPFGMIHPFLRNSTTFLDYSDSNGDGIEVCLFLEEKEMENLQSSLQFCAFAYTV